RSPQAGALPDAMAGLSLFALPPETRVGPQRLTASVSQRFPGRGKRSLASSGMELEAEAADHRMEAERLRLATETRRHVYELAFLAERAEILAEEREHLVRHEELARARYASGAGLQQEAVKIQAAITRREQALLDLEILRRRHLASLNALRDRPADTDAEGARLPSPEPLALELMALRPVALSRRPDLAAARSMSAAAARQVELAEKAAVPDWTVGLGYTLVDRRQDEAGRRLPPQGNGNDILALNASVSLPVWGKRRTAQLQEALERQSSAREQERLLTAQFEADLGEVAGRLPLLYQQWHLFETVLEEQAQEALRSAESAYTTGRLNALDLLDAEHVLFEVRTGKARAAADWALAWADLEGVLATAVPREED
ncbi:MAG: TolC family protein, partial [Acidobacteria bacterium]|nr:TolC family protein [Acidobacteriota bacterium]